MPEKETSSYSQKTQSIRRRTLNWSQCEGALYGVMVGSSETFAFYYAVKHGLTSFQLATITLLPVALGAIANWLIPRFVKDHHLKPAILILVVHQIIGLVGLFYSVQQANYYPWILLSLIFYYVGGMSAGPIWVDWISGWLPPDRMGRYLSRRNSFVAAVTLITFLVIATLVYQSETLLVFQIVFGIATLARLASCTLLLFQKSPPALRLEKYTSMSLKEIRVTKPLVIAILFTAAFRFSSNIAAAFFLPYMLDDLHFTLLQFALITAVPYVGRALFLARWGEATRSLRPFIGLQVALLALSFVALFWTMTTSFSILCLIEFMSGVFWGGYELCTVLIFQNYAHGKARGLIGMHTALTNITALSGAYFGALLLNFGTPYVQVFDISFGFRLAIAVFFIMTSLRLAESQKSIRIYGEFLTSILSLRTAFAEASRIIPARRRKENSKARF